VLSVFETNKEKINKMKNIRNIFLLIIAVAFTACNNQQSSESTELATPVSVENVKRSDIQEVPIFRNLLPQQERQMPLAK
jgi:hypothetical protein